MKKMKVSAFGRMLKLGAAITKATTHIALEKIQEKINDNDQLRKIQSQVIASKEIIKVMSEMRGGVMKLGQMLSITDDLILPPEVTTLFKTLQKSAHHMTDDELKETFYRNFKQRPEDIFEEFERIPFAAASIGQVHLGKLKSGEQVAIKVQYPKIVNAIKNDFSNIEKIDKLFGKIYKNKPNLHLMIEELKHSLVLECDYFHEAKQMSFFKQHLEKEFAVIYIPKNYPQFSTKEILTMEYVTGDSFEETLNYSQADKDFLGKNIYESFLFCLWGLNKLHTDPQNGNFLFRPNKIIILDFGSTRDFEKDFLSNYLKLLLSVEEDNFSEYCQYGKNLEFFKIDEQHDVMKNHFDMIKQLYLPYLKNGAYAVVGVNPVQLLKSFMTQIDFKGRKSPRREFFLLDRSNLGIFTKLNAWQSKVDWLLGKKKYRDQLVSKLFE